MSAGKKKLTVPWESVSIRLPPDRVRQFELRAAANNTYRGTYIADLLMGKELEPLPTLAALGRLIAMHETVRLSGAIGADQLNELRSILCDFAKLARGEALQ